MQAPVEPSIARLLGHAFQSIQHCISVVSKIDRLMAGDDIEPCALRYVLVTAILTSEKTGGQRTVRDHINSLVDAQR